MPYIVSKKPEQFDLFTVAVSDVGHRDQLDLMAVPVVSLAKGKRVEPIKFSRGNTTVEVSAPAHIGIATIWDLDIVLWCIAQLNDAMNKGSGVSPVIKTSQYDILKGLGKPRSGDEYRRLKDALDRLKATNIRTTIRAEGKRWDSFSLIDRITWTEDDQKRPNGVEITVPHWIYAAVADRRVLSIAPEYFNITSGLGRWLYRLARKMAGNNAAGWSWTLEELHERSGVTSSLRQFSYDLKKVVRSNQLPEYAVTLVETKAKTAGAKWMVHAVRRSKLAIGEPGYEAPIRRSSKNPKGV